MEQFKEKEIDPVGLGHFVGTQIRNFDINKWTDTQYKELIVKVESDVKITETGGIE
jgi:spore germination protein